MKQIQRVHHGAPVRLSQLLATLTGLGQSDVSTLIAMGGAYLGKLRCKDPNHMIRRGDLVAAFYRQPLIMEPVPFNPQWIVEDKGGILIANKPSGMPTQGRRDADYMAFYEVLKQHLDGYLGLHHRLDQDTSGLMLFARDRALNKDIARAFQERLVHKQYLAVVSGGWPFSEEDVIIKDPIGAFNTPQGRRHGVMKNGKEAQTRVRLLAESEGLLLVSAKPLTGRTHQIRIHLSKHGMPLRGDTWYGGPAGSGFQLHCCGLAWPKTGGLAAGNYQLSPPQSWRDNLPQELLGGLSC